MVLISIEDLKKSPHITDEIRWDVTPKVFFDPSPAHDKTGNEPDITYGYMLYVDLIDDKPALVIMQLRKIMSRTVGYVRDIPEELFKEAMQCPDSDSVGGMRPLPETLEPWLKKEFGLA